MTGHHILNAEWQTADLLYAEIEKKYLKDDVVLPRVTRMFDVKTTEYQ